VAPLKRWMVILSIAVALVIVDAALVVWAADRPPQPARPVPGPMDCDVLGPQQDNPACLPAPIDWVPYEIAGVGILALGFSLAAIASLNLERTRQYWHNLHLEDERPEMAEQSNRPGGVL
jgi:hypothetical protein